MSSDATNRSLVPLLLVQEQTEPVVRPAPVVHLSDEDLLVRLEAGDRAAAALLFDRHADLIFGIGLRILRDKGEAEDLVQDVFVGLVEKVHGFDPAKGNGRTWIVMIGYRRAFDRRAYLARRCFYRGTELGPALNSIQHATFNEQLADVFAVERLHSAMQSLNEKQRITLELHFFEGLALREVGEQLGETLENTRHFYYRGLERLRRVLTGGTSN